MNKLLNSTWPIDIYWCDNPFLPQTCSSLSSLNYFPLISIEFSQFFLKICLDFRWQQSIKFYYLCFFFFILFYIVFVINLLLFIILNIFHNNGIKWKTSLEDIELDFIHRVVIIKVFIDYLQYSSIFFDKFNNQFLQLYKKQLYFI